MKKKVLRIYMLILPVIFMSCKKSVEPADPCMPYSVPEFRIKEILTFKNNKYCKSEYFYDSLGRVNHRRDSGEYFNDVFWIYNATNILMLNNDSFAYQTLHLNIQGYAADNSGSFILPYSSWEYDSSGYMTEEHSSTPQAGTASFTYSYRCWNKISVSKSWSWFGGPPTEAKIIQTIEYYPDRKNTIGNENLGIHYFGKQNNCLVYRVISYEDAVADTAGTYFYEYDSLSRVITETIKKAGDVIQIRTFKYNAD